MTFGRDTLVKFIGGQMIARQAGTDFATLQRDIAAVGQRFRDLTVPFLQFAPIWFKQERQIFQAEGIPKWPALSPAYESWKQRHFPGKPILQMSGDLYRSVTSITPQTIFDPHPRSLRLGTKNPLSAIHQTGSRNIPARPHVVLMPATFQALSDLCMNYILSGGGKRRR